MPLISKHVKRPKQPGWITNEITSTIINRDKAKKRKTHEEYKQLRNQVTNLVRDAKSAHYKEAIEKHKNNHKMLSTVFKELQNKSSLNHPAVSLRYQDQVSNNDHDIAEAFNKHFTSIAEKCLKPLADKPTEHPDHTALKEFVRSKLPPGNIYKIPCITEHVLSLNSYQALILIKPQVSTTYQPV